MSCEVRVSKHARKRIKERCGIGKSSADRMAQLAVERGTDRLNTKGQLRAWLDTRYDKQMGGNIFVYGDKAYIVAQDRTLVTVLFVPNNLRKNLKKMMIRTA